MPGYILVDREALYMTIIVAGCAGLLIGWSVAVWLVDNEDNFRVWGRRAKIATVEMMRWARAFFKRTGKHRPRRRPRGHGATVAAFRREAKA